MDIAIVCASHNDEILQANLLRSPVIAEARAPLHLERGAATAAIASRSDSVTDRPKCDSSRSIAAGRSAWSIRHG